MNDDSNTPFEKSVLDRASSGSRDARLGFPDDIETLAARYRGVVATRHPAKPRPVGIVLVALDQVGLTDGIKATDLSGGWAVDFLIDLRGADEFSRSALVFTDDGSFLGGTLRAGSVVINGTTQSEVADQWVTLLTEGVGLRLDADDLETEVRVEGESAAGPATATPHVYFSSRRPKPDPPYSDLSPVTSGQLIAIVKTLAERWQSYFSDYTFSSRAIKAEMGEGTVETIGSVDDMLDNF